MTNALRTASGSVWRVAEDSAARWIFPACAPDAVNQIVDFLQTFHCDRPDDAAELRISADSDFIVWLNGELLGFGQYSNYPDQKTFERLAAGHALRQGANTLACTVFYNGRNSSVYRRGEPGLIFELRAGKPLAVSAAETLTRFSPCYHSGPIAAVSGQLSYTFGYDARRAGGPVPEAKGGEGWRTIAETELRMPPERSVLGPRPVPRLVDRGCTQATLVDAGFFRFDEAAAAAEFEARPAGQEAAGLLLEGKPDSPMPISPAWQMQHSHLSSCKDADAPAPIGRQLQDEPLYLEPTKPEGQDGLYLLFDLGREEVGHLELDIEAPAGALLDIGYGEHLEDGGVRTWVGGRNFAGRYICRGGRQRFMHPFLRWAGRYLQLHIRARERVALHQLGLRRREYPLEERGQLSTGSALHERLLTTAARTLQLCIHEHYEDTPWREQALYANDARTQALCGYYAFGEIKMPAASFTLLGQGLREDGFLNLTAPARPPVTIPSFTFAWMLALRDYYLYSGDDRLARAFLPQVCSMLRAFLRERKNDLLPLRRQQGIWHFYDWSAGMSGYSKEEFAQGLEVDAPLNCFLILALDAAEQMLDWCGEDPAEDLIAAAAAGRRAVAARFWDSAEDAFRTHDKATVWTELTQALAILARAGDRDMRERALARLGREDSGLAAPGLSQSLYTFEALLTCKERFGARVLASIEQTWGDMLEAGATTFWETIKGARDFSGAGSLCHGWSSVPLYVFYHDVLGLRPLEPGFREFAVDPMSTALTACSGQVPVPDGEISLTWERRPGGRLETQLSAPEALKARLSSDSDAQMEGVPQSLSKQSHSPGDPHAPETASPHCLF